MKKNENNIILVDFLDDSVPVRITNYTPARPAPIAYCPDQEGYSDEGDAEELEFDILHDYPVVLAFLEDSEDFYQAVLEVVRS